MTTPYAGNPASYPATISLVDDGEPAAARIVNPPWQQLADRTAYLSAGLTAESAARAAADASHDASIALHSAALTPLASLAALTSIAAPTDGLVRLVSERGWYVFASASVASADGAWCLVADDSTPGRWLHVMHAFAKRTQTLWVPAVRAIGISASSATPKAVSHSLESLAAANSGVGLDRFFFIDVVTASATARHVAFDLTPYLAPFMGGTIASAELWVDPQNAHGSLPALRPAFTIVRRPMRPSTTQEVLYSGGTSGWAVDASASVAAYEVEHSIALPCDQNNRIAPGYHYYAYVHNEGHTGALSVLNVIGLELSISTLPGGI